jgi:hypothetical protein
MRCPRVRTLALRRLVLGVLKKESRVGSRVLGERLRNNEVRS